MNRVLPLLTVAMLLGTAGQCWAGVGVERLRCEYLENPLGLDVTNPRLSWILQSDERGQTQTAYQVLVASTPRILARDQGDLWDSGRVESDQTIHVEYAGRPLISRSSCHWKVRAWDRAGRPSPWSKPASWTMGLLEPSDWDAKWIALARDPSQPRPVTPCNGHQSGLAESADAVQWIAVDFGEDLKIDAIRLHPARSSDCGDTPGFLFPVRFKIEVAQKADFSDAVMVVDRTVADVPNPGLEAPIYRFRPIPARYVRLTVTKLARRDESSFGFALAEMQIFSGSHSTAKFALVTASDSVELGGWSKTNLVSDRLSSGRGADDGSRRPATMVRKEFVVRGSVKRAVVSVTGLGLYELRINGQRVGNHLLAPEWTRYSKRIQYQTYDVTDLLRNGRNAVGAQLSGGWWTGPLMTKPPMKDPRFCLLMRLDVELADGSTRTVATDQTWQATDTGPIRRAGIYFGEIYDATKEMPGWDEPGFAASGWRPVQVLPHPDMAEKAILAAQPNEPMRMITELRPVDMTEPRPGVYVFDMGQNMVGWCRLKTNAPAGTEIVVRYAEMLDEDGMLYVANLRGAAQINKYVLRGGESVLEPHFTYHGFRYVELTGLPDRPAKDSVVGRVFHSSMPDAGEFSCSNELINKIMHCVEWAQRGNMHGVPTDCPQRDEREGWLGDIQAFSQTAIFNMNMAGFFTKWVPDIRDSQADDGRYPDVAPHVADPNRLHPGMPAWCILSGSPAWGDAGTIVPWRMYQNYADTRMLQQHFDSARRWVDFIGRHNPDSLWRNNRGNDYSDWLNGDTTELSGYPRGISAVPKEVFATAFFARSTEIVAKMAKVLGREDDAAQYSRQFAKIKSAFNREFVTADGHIKGDTQAGYALALHFNLLDEPLRPKAAMHLLEAIKKYGNHPSTGIQTTHRMMLELTRNGCHHEACRLINLRTIPSWGYMVDRDATTIWERWDGYVKGRGFQGPSMNSFNHLALGSVGEWVWRELAGINPDEEHPGYKHFFIRPRPSGDLTWVKARYDSIRGPITSEWKTVAGQFHLNVEIPANTTATVFVPTGDAGNVTESGTPVAQAAGVKYVRMENGAAVFTVQSGCYRFTAH